MPISKSRNGLCVFCVFRLEPKPNYSLKRQHAAQAQAQPQKADKGFRVRYSGDSRRYLSERPLARRVKNSDFTFQNKTLRRSKESYDGRLSKHVARRLREQVTDQDLIRLTIERLRWLSELSKDADFLVKTGLILGTAEARLAEFEAITLRSLEAWNETSDSGTPPPLLGPVRQAFTENAQAGIDAQLKFALQGYVANHAFTKSDILNQARLADLRYPYEWYPATRAMQRKIHLHVGPTNSGKTYHALKRLESAKSGIYAGPLRLLAHEVYTRLNALGKPCDLVTGDERVIVESADGPRMASCTVEMVPVNRSVEVAVVDEIQMIGNDRRGWAWTQAVLGLKAQELHLCGEERAVPLIKELAAAMGDQLEIHHYERLSPLRTMSTSLDGDLKKLRKGDCLVVFSRMQIHAMRQDIERITGKRVAVVYGSLPPEIRAQQAKLFNNPDNEYDFLVASDAIGMGLNLSIKRIIFQSTSRHNGDSLQTLPVSDIKQIAGRAGRYRTALAANTEATARTGPRNGDQLLMSRPTPVSSTTNLGLVTTLEQADLPIVQRAMQSEAGPMTNAGIFPPDEIIVKFSNYFPPETPFGYILLRLYEIARMHPRFNLCNLREYIMVADLIQPVKNLTISDRIALCAAPVALKDSDGRRILLAFAERVATQIGGALLEITELDLEILDEIVTAERDYLKRLESLHKSLVLYLWLSYRFTGIFTSQSMAFHVKHLTEEKIDRVLTEFSRNRNFRDHLKKLRERALLQAFRTQAELQERESRSLPELSDHSKLQLMGMEDRLPGIVLDETIAKNLHGEDPSLVPNVMSAGIGETPPA